MFSSIFGAAAPVDPHAPNFHPVTDRFQPSEFFGELEPKDIEMACATGFVTEVQSWYHFLDDGSVLVLQLIHSGVGVWYPTIQFTFKLWKPDTKEKTWVSVNVADFVCPANPKLDKRSYKSDKATVIFKESTDPAFPEAYDIRANLTDDLQVSLLVSRLGSAPGFKLGKGPKGGFSQFGVDAEKPDGYVVHRFWPRTKCSGAIIHKGQAITANGNGMFVHAIQGMRPNLVGSRWNFANFHSNEHGGVSAISMEFTTIDAYGKRGAGSGHVTVSVGSVVVGGKLLAVTGETIFPDQKPAFDSPVQSRATHLDTELDEETGYHAPKRILFNWAAPSVDPSAKGNVTASLEVDVGSLAAPKGLIEKIDILAEIPYVIKSLVNYVAGTKPFIYQYYNPTTLTITGPPALLGKDSNGTLTVQGHLFNEASFVSEP